VTRELVGEEKQRFQGSEVGEIGWNGTCEAVGGEIKVEQVFQTTE